MNTNFTCMLAMWSPGPLEFVVIGLVLLLVFGKKLPDLARGLGKSFVEFKRGLSDVTRVKKDISDEIKEATDTKFTENVTSEKDSFSS